MSESGLFYGRERVVRAANENLLRVGDVAFDVALVDEVGQDAFDLVHVDVLVLVKARGGRDGRG